MVEQEAKELQRGRPLLAHSRAKNSPLFCPPICMVCMHACKHARMDGCMVGWMRKTTELGPTFWASSPGFGSCRASQVGSVG